MRNFGCKWDLYGEFHNDLRKHNIFSESGDNSQEARIRCNCVHIGLNEAVYIYELTDSYMNLSFIYKFAP